MASIALKGFVIQTILINMCKYHKHYIFFSYINMVAALPTAKRYIDVGIKFHLKSAFMNCILSRHWIKQVINY